MYVMSKSSVGHSNSGLNHFTMHDLFKMPAIADPGQSAVGLCVAP